MVAGLLSVQRVLGALSYGSSTDVARIQVAVNKVHGNYGRLLVDLVKMVNFQHGVAIKNGAGSPDDQLLNKFAALRRTLLKFLLRYLALLATYERLVGQAVPTEAFGETVKLIKFESRDPVILNQLLRADVIDPSSIEYLSGQQLATKQCMKMLLVCIIEKSLRGPISDEENDILNAIRLVVCRTGLLDDQVA